MNEAQKILRKEMETIQHCIKNLETSIGLKEEALEKHKKNLKEIIDGLMVLEEKPKPLYEDPDIRSKK